LYCVDNSKGSLLATVATVRRILETSLYVEDLERSAAFYAKVFGFTPLVRDGRMCAMAVPGQQVLLLFVKGRSAASNPSPAGLIPGHNGNGTQHLCFSISHDNLNAWTRHLMASDIEVETRLDWPQGASSLYFRDPDGHSIEVGTPRL
jgi:catechol 2,3-dioxygenase-like lactoylglutathione lyase family enzyme